MFVSLVEIMKDGMERNVFVEQAITRLKVSVGLAILIVTIMVETVFVIMDIMVMRINAKNAMKLVENVQALVQKIVLLVLM